MQNTYVFTKDEYTKKYGQTGESANDEEFKRDIAEVCEFMLDHVTANSTINWSERFANNRVSDFQIKTLKKACMIQFKYECENGKLRNYAGVDADTGNITSTIELNEKIIAPEADKLLNRYGFYYKGLY